MMQIIFQVLKYHHRLGFVAELYYDIREYKMNLDAIYEDVRQLQDKLQNEES